PPSSYLTSSSVFLPNLISISLNNNLYFYLCNSLTLLQTRFLRQFHLFVHRWHIYHKALYHHPTQYHTSNNNFYSPAPLFSPPQKSYIYFFKKYLLFYLKLFNSFFRSIGLIKISMNKTPKHTQPIAKGLILPVTKNKMIKSIPIGNEIIEL